MTQPEIIIFLKSFGVVKMSYADGNYFKNLNVKS